MTNKTFSRGGGDARVVKQKACCLWNLYWWEKWSNWTNITKRYDSDIHFLNLYCFLQKNFHFRSHCISYVKKKSAFIHYNHRDRRKGATCVKNLHWMRMLKVLRAPFYFLLQLHQDYLSFLSISSGESSAYFCLTYLSLFRQQMSNNMIFNHNHI